MERKPIEFVNKNVVIIANQFNVPIFNQHWLIVNDIILEKDLIKDTYTFTPVFSQINTDSYQLTISPERLQLNFNPSSDDQNISDLIESKIGKIVNNLPHTPYTAFGLNFGCFFTPNTQDFQEFTRTTFSNPESPLVAKFDDGNPLFGGYFSKDFLAFRVNLKTIPMIDKSKNEKVRFDFNFHVDLTNEKDGASIILEQCKQWNKVIAFVDDVMDCL